nr:WYL domain-containing protein [Microbacterium sp.]
MSGVPIYPHSWARWRLASDRRCAHRPDRSHRVRGHLGSRRVEPEAPERPQVTTVQRMIADVEGLGGRVRAVIRAEPWAVRAVCDRFGRQARVIDGDGRLIEVRAHRTDALAEQLAAWTSAIEVIKPPEIRTALRELGERLVERYRTPESQIR